MESVLKLWQRHSFVLRKYSYVCPGIIRTFASIQSEVNVTTYTSHTAKETSVKLQDPLDVHDYFGVRNLVTVRELFDARVHLGHKSGTQNKYMRPFIFGNRLGVDIIDLEQSRTLLGDALNFAAHIASRKGIIMFVNRNKQTIPLVERTAYECKEYSHCRDFRIGTFTNAVVTYGLETRMPDLVIFICTHNNVFGENAAVTECSKMNIPSIGILDTNCDPRLINYPVPGNDDTPIAIELYCRLFKHAILTGKSKTEEIAATYEALQLHRNQAPKEN